MGRTVREIYFLSTLTMGASNKENATSMGNAENVMSQENGLMEVYRQAFDALTSADRAGFSDLQRANIGMLDSSLDSPEEISFDKAVAVLKAILDTQPSIDRIHLEYFFPVPTGKGNLTVGSMIREELRNLGVSLWDLQAFAKEKGWISGV